MTEMLYNTTTTTEVVSPKDLVREIEAGVRMKIRFVPPRIGSSDFGRFVVKYDTPKRVRVFR
jgi:hypothetical protein